ncbi:MAG: DUF6442 family protein [Coprobacillus sp.]
MNKEEILKRSRNENKSGDEREKTLEQRSSQNAYIAIMGVFLILAIIAFIQEITTGKAFIDSRICSLVFVVGIAGRFCTSYIYNKDKTSLVISLAAIGLSILYIIRLLWS